MCKNQALNIRDYVSLVERGSSVVGAHIQDLDKFVYPTLPIGIIVEETLKVVGPFYLVYMSGEVTVSTQGVNVYPVVYATFLVKGNSLNHSCVSPRMSCLEYITKNCPVLMFLKLDVYGSRRLVM